MRKKIVDGKLYLTSLKDKIRRYISEDGKLFFETDKATYVAVAYMKHITFADFYVSDEQGRISGFHPYTKEGLDGEWYEAVNYSIYKVGEDESIGKPTEDFQIVWAEEQIKEYENGR